MRPFALGFVLAMWWLQHQSSLPHGYFAAVGAVLLLACLGIPRRHRAVGTGACLAAGALLGIGLGAWRAEVRLADALPFEWEGRDVQVTGLVASLPQPGEKGTRFAFDVESIGTEGANAVGRAHVPPRVALTWYADRSREGRDAPPPRLAAGERWTFTVRLKRPRGLANPHGFDFEAWALERGLRAGGYVRAKPSPTRLAVRVDGWPYTLHRWRGELRDRMVSHLGEGRFRGVLVALALGDQDAIGVADWQVFWRTGVGHLMSISGLHITMLAALAAAITAFAWLRIHALALRWPARKVALSAGVAVALAYALLTGFAVPAQRTVLMLATVAACVLADRHGSPSRVLALAALVVVGVDPWAVLAAGFWLSFGAVGAIFYAFALRTGRPGRLQGAVVEQLAVTLVMAPMMLAIFQEVSLVSPLSNAFAIPVVSLVVVPLTLAGVFLDLGALLQAAHALMAWLMVPLESLAALPGAVLESHAPVGWTVACGVAGCAWLLAPRGFPLRLLALAWIAPMFLVLPPRPPPGEAWVDVLDVGQGLAIVVRTASHALVYDTGPSWSSESDSGSRIVVPFLRGEGVRHLDGLVVTHADDDHAGGAPSVAAARWPDWLLSSLPPDAPLRSRFTLGWPCAAGQDWAWDGVHFLVVHPAEAQRDEARRRENDRSCVLRVAAQGASVLLTGDAEARSESEMIARGVALLRADVLVVPHHGSKTSSTARFLDAVAPLAAVNSLGYRNRFRHPHEAVVRRYDERGIAVWGTDVQGALRIVLPVSGFPRIVRLAPPDRYWSDRSR